MNIRSLNLKWLFGLLLVTLRAQVGSAQYVYKIKADTVRIYNTCDTAELVLQNRTQNVLGFLYNKGQGVTEFRSLSDNFIQNQGLVAQPANFNISGFGNLGGVLNVAGGYVNLNNPNGNFILMGGGGVAGPALVKRSTGTRIVLYPSMNAGPTFMDHAIGMEAGHIWLATATNDTANGFKFYGGITPIGQIDGKGSSEWAGMGRFKGWYTSGTGQGLETGVLRGAGVVQAYDRSVGTYIPLVLTGGGTSLRSLTIDGTGVQLNAFGNQKLLATDANGYIVDGSSSFLAWRQRTQPDLNTLDTDVSDVSGSYFLTSFQPQNGIPHNNYGVYNFFRLSGDGLYKGIIAFGTNDGSIYTRRKANGTWDSTWRAVWDSGNQLGIANQTTTQAKANFNIDGTGTVGGTFSVVNGNAGIGTTSPGNYGFGAANRYIEVLNPNSAANSQAHIILSTGSVAQGAIGSIAWISKNATTQQRAAYIAAYLDSTATLKPKSDLTFATANDSMALERMRITRYGMVGIGTPTPKYALDVVGQGHFQSAIIGSGVSGFYQDANNGSYRAFGAMNSATNRGFFLQDSAGLVTTMYVGLTGTYARKVGVNTTAPTVALDVAGDIHASGAITAPSISQTSLRSLKKDIKPFTASALNILDSAQVRTFIFKADTTNTTRIGFIADEVPDAMASTGRKGVEETNTVALLVKAIQEMKAEVEALQQHVHELETQLKEKNK